MYKVNLLAIRSSFNFAKLPKGIKNVSGIPPTRLVEIIKEVVNYIDSDNLQPQENKAQ